MLFKDFLEIDEMSTVSRSSNMFIAVNPDIHRVGDEYFKLYNASILNNADKVIRIQFRKPRYVFHKNTGFEDWILTKSEKRALVHFLNTKETMYDSDGVKHEITIFQKAIILHNYERGLGNNASETLSLLLENVYDDYMPLDLKMPDYMLLGNCLKE